MRVLVADASSLLRGQMVEMLCDLEGVEVVGQARDALGALSAASALAPDVTLLDLQMFGGGVDVLRQIKRGGRAPVVIVMSSQVSPPYRERCLAAGADFFFDKAIEIDEVRRVIRDLQPLSGAADA